MKDYYRYRFIRPGLAPDKGLARVIGWVLGAGIPLVIWSIEIEGKGIRGADSWPEQAGTLVFVFGVVLALPALLLGAIWPRLARVLAACFLGLGLFGAMAQGLFFPSPHRAGPVIASAVFIYFAVGLVILRHWTPESRLDSCTVRRPGDTGKPGTGQPGADRKVNPVIRRILVRWRRRGRRARRAMPE